MTAYLKDLVDKVVSIVTNDGRNIVGTLKGFDQTINLVLADSHERTFSEDKGMEKEPLGLYIVRGDSIAVVGEIDEAADEAIDWEEVRGAPLKPIIQGGV